MSSPIIVAALALIFIYYLGIVIFVTRLAVRSGRLKHFEEVTPEDIAVLFDGIDGASNRRRAKKGGTVG